jgi:hypothetical protein
MPQPWHEWVSRQSAGFYWIELCLARRPAGAGIKNAPDVAIRGIGELPKLALLLLF